MAELMTESLGLSSLPPTQDASPSGSLHFGMEDDMIGPSPKRMRMTTENDYNKKDEGALEEVAALGRGPTLVDENKKTWKVTAFQQFRESFVV